MAVHGLRRPKVEPVPGVQGRACAAVQWCGNNFCQLTRTVPPHTRAGPQVILSITWGLIASFIAVFLPLYEARESLWNVLHNLITCTTPTEEDEITGVATPGEFAKQIFPAPSIGNIALDAPEVEKEPKL